MRAGSLHRLNFHLACVHSTHFFCGRQNSVETGQTLKQRISSQLAVAWQQHRYYWLEFNFMR